MYQQLEWDITQIDTGFIADEIAACYLLESEGEIAIIETGNFATTERILTLLEQRQIPKEKVRFVILTHIHLDHAGGASSLMQALPSAKLVVHPRGARHMSDPSKLIAGATVVYGEENFQALYGEIKPIAAQRIIQADDNTSLTIGRRKLLFRDTPGHANHHFCIWDKMSSGWFTGDTFGVSYPQLSNDKERFLFPTTSPIQFNPHALISSIELMMNYQPERMYLTHFGVIDVNRDMSNDLSRQIRDYVSIAEALNERQMTEEHLLSLLTEYTFQDLSNKGCTVESEKIHHIIAMDMKLNAQGLLLWFSRN